MSQTIKMPVTIYPSPEIVGQNKDPTVQTEQELLRATSRAWTKTNPAPLIHSNKKDGPENRPIIQSSFHDLPGTSTIIPYGNGLVDGIIRAFNQDLNLVLRPDDIWLAILTQFSMFVNGNAELLRAHFVAHKGRKTLTVDMTPFPLKAVNMGRFALEMIRVIQGNVVDPELRDLILPNFSTTTENDTSVASAVMIGALENYFEYRLLYGCGFPSVTLLGEKSDWEEILSKVQKLPKYGRETAEWSRILIPTIQHMISTFDDPDSQQIKDFWLRTCHAAGTAASGIRTLSGWITAFSFWSEEGKPIRGFSDEELEEVPSGATLAQRKRLVLDGVAFPLVNPEEIPKGVVMVSVTIRDFDPKLEYQTTMVAGSVGMTVTGDGSKVQPVSGWLMLEDSVKPISVEALQHETDYSTSPTLQSEASVDGSDDCVVATFHQSKEGSPQIDPDKLPVVASANLSHRKGPSSNGAHKDGRSRKQRNCVVQ